MKRILQAIFWQWYNGTWALFHALGFRNTRPLTSFAALLEWQRAETGKPAGGEPFAIAAIINRTWVEWAVFAAHMLRHQGYRPVILYSRREIDSIYGDNPPASFLCITFRSRFLSMDSIEKIDIDGLPSRPGEPAPGLRQYIDQQKHSVASYAIKVEEYEEHFYTKEYQAEVQRWEAILLESAGKLTEVFSSRRFARLFLPSGLIGRSPAYLYAARANNLETVCIEGWAQRPGHMIWAFNQPALIYDIRGWMQTLGPWSDEKDKDQRDLMNFQEQILSDREDEWLSNFHSVQRSTIDDELPEPLKLFLKRDGVLFLCGTNVIGDSSTLLRAQAFRNQKEWLISLIEFFKERPQYNLIIRAHPDEVWQKSKIRISDFVRPLIRNIDNVFLIGGEENVNSYSLIRYAKIGLFWLSNIGNDMFMRGKPVIMAARPKYDVLNIMAIPQTRDEYFSLIDRYVHNPVIPTTEQVNMARYYQLIVFKEMSLKATSHDYQSKNYRITDPLPVEQDTFYRVLTGRLGRFGR